jgi:hypothetical protein
MASMRCHSLALPGKEIGISPGQERERERERERGGEMANFRKDCTNRKKGHVSVSISA